MKITASGAFAGYRGHRDRSSVRIAAFDWAVGFTDRNDERDQPIQPVLAGPARKKVAQSAKTTYVFEDLRFSLHSC
jgi:hypothetical protein